MSFVYEAVKQRVKQDCEFSYLFNPLFPEFYFYFYNFIINEKPKIQGFVSE